MPKKNDISDEKLRVILAYERMIKTHREEVAKNLEAIQHATLEIARLRGEEVSTNQRAWIWVKNKLKMSGRPMTKEEFYDTCASIRQFAMQLDPKKARADMDRMLAKAKALKEVNGLVGLAEWPDDKFLP